MPRQSNGSYLPPANTAAVSGTTISSTAFNTLETDIGTEITNSLDRQGRSAMQANLPMGSNKITGMADPTVSTDAATKNYVDTTTAAFFSTGDMKPTLKNVADAGWILFDDGTFGSATSGSSSRANADAQSLFTLFFNNMSDTAAPLFTSGGGATTRAAQVSAANAWAANCRMSLPKTLGRVLGMAGAGSGLTSRALGVAVGAETVALAQNQLPNVSPTFTGIQQGVSSNNTNVNLGGTLIGGITSGGGGIVVSNGPLVTGQVSMTFTPSGVISSINGNVAQASTLIMQPTTFVNWMVKL